LQNKIFALKYSIANRQLSVKALVVPILLIHCVFQWQSNSSLFSINQGGLGVVIAWQAHLVSVVTALLYQFSMSTAKKYDSHDKSKLSHHESSSWVNLLIH